MEIIKMKLSDITMYEKNAKKHPKKQVQQIVKSIKEFGFNDPIAIDENNVIIEGHGRYLAMQEMGEAEAPCIQLKHLNKKQKKAYILAHNKLTLNSGYDQDIMNEELKSIFDMNLDADLGVEVNMEAFGFDFNESFDVLGYLNEGEFSKTLTENSDEFQITFTLPKEIKEKIISKKEEIREYIIKLGGE